MAFPRSIPIKFTPTTLSDSVDGSSAPPGAMASLANLIPDPAARGIYVSRPAAMKSGDFVAGGFSSPGFVSGELVIGDIVYGTLASAKNAGKDEPYCFNKATAAFIAVSGVTNTNSPTSPAATGTWTPPILSQVGGRVIVTHPGFPGGATKFGWFDVSGFTETVAGNTHSNTLIDGSPSVLAVQPGDTVSGTGITAGTTVVSTAEVVLVQAGDTHTSTLIDNLPVSAARAVAQFVAGSGVPAGAFISALTSATSVTISVATTSTLVQTPITFTGSTITLSAAATATANSVTLTIAGGTPTAPLWGAGDTDRNNLPSVPVGVAQMNGRAWFACGTSGIPWSDALLPCRITNSLAVQALTTNDGLAVTAIGALQLNSLQGGIVKSLFAFEGVSKIQQITGDQVTSDLRMNDVPVATGTFSPLSVCSTEKGLAFVSPEGLRIIDFTGAVSTPIGEGGRGVTLPFINVLYPSRTCAAASADVIRISVQSALATARQEFWLDLSRGEWTGPHSFPASLIQPWRNSFVMTSLLAVGLWQSDKEPGLTSAYVENGTLLTWTFQPSPLPDTEQMAMNSLVEMTVACALAPGTVVTVIAQDIAGGYLDTTTFGPSGTPALWGAFNWGAAVWGGAGSPYQQYAVNWNIDLVFKQLNLQFQGSSNYNVKIGNMNMRYQILGYKLQATG